MPRTNRTGCSAEFEPIPGDPPSFLSLQPGARRAILKGIKEEMTLYELGRAA